LAKEKLYDRIESKNFKRGILFMEIVFPWLPSSGGREAWSEVNKDF